MCEAEATKRELCKCRKRWNRNRKLFRKAVTVANTFKDSIAPISNHFTTPSAHAAAQMSEVMGKDLHLRSLNEIQEAVTSKPFGVSRQEIPNSS